MPAVKKRSTWWQKNTMDRICRVVPPDCRAEVREVLTALDPENAVAAFLYLIREYKVEVLNQRQRLGAPPVVDPREERESVMKTLEWNTVDKSGWGPGEWQDEPDKRQWQDEATGLPCLAVRNEGGGHWCGYVGLPPGHPMHGKDYNDVDVEVHGGLTFAATCAEVEDDPSRFICHLPEPGEPEKVWWLGFDCHHHMDFAPGSQTFNERVFPGDRLFARDPSETYRTLGYVQGQCARLALQIGRAAA